jgi:hypothetical protein
MTKPDFFAWFDKVSANAATTEVGKLMLANGFEIMHTGGGCLAWDKPVGETHLWVCDEGNGLGDKIDELYLVGHYNKDGDEIAVGDEPDLNAALAWCKARIQ